MKRQDAVLNQIIQQETQLLVRTDPMDVLGDLSEFIQEAGWWYYVDGVQFPTVTQTIARNGVCPCGSQRKYKNCHGKS